MNKENKSLLVVIAIVLMVGTVAGLYLWLKDHSLLELLFPAV